MPELPEVETVRRGLAPAMEGAFFDRVSLARSDLRFPFPDAFADRLTGAKVLTLSRRGKYLIAALSTGETLIMHLGMTGRFTVLSTGQNGADATSPGEFHHKAGDDAKHDHVHFDLRQKDGTIVEIVYNDVRRFGFMDLAPTDGLPESKHFRGMGPEPLSNEFSADILNAALAGKATPIKAALLDQRVVAGLGNIYVCEALFRAGISPRRKARSVAGKRGERLAPAIIQVLRAAIDAGGSTLRDFAASDGSLGYFQHAFQVYDREGEPCVTCQTPVKRLGQSGRSTFYCPTCQR
ncbi:MAG: bifunctional DNA-formamidopyrimidine glycosylase/DNA-(apurinic or apyrimidinic site) lyase [Pseudomonadota bacterium]